MSGTMIRVVELCWLAARADAPFRRLCNPVWTAWDWLTGRPAAGFAYFLTVSGLAASIAGDVLDGVTVAGAIIWACTVLAIADAAALGKLHEPGTDGACIDPHAVIIRGLYSFWRLNLLPAVVLLPFNVATGPHDDIIENVGLVVLWVGLAAFFDEHPGLGTTVVDRIQARRATPIPT